MATYSFFLASSFELKSERERIELILSKKNKELSKYNVFLDLTVWEDEDESIAPTRKQNDYNEKLKVADVLIILYWTKVGKYTLEEFNLAYELSKSNNRVPRVYVYEKELGNEVAGPGLIDFKNLMNEIEHFPRVFTSLDSLENLISQRITTLVTNGFIKTGVPAKLLSPNGAADPNYFIGREEELRKIRERLNATGKLMIINAEGGIGKTTLAARYWNESLFNYKHNAWLFCENGIINSLKDLAPGLNLDLEGLDEKQQVAKLKRALMEVHDQLLLVLDNANDPVEIQEFRQEFEGFHWHVLITSRCNGVLDENQELPITHLPPPLAKDLFVKYYHEDTPDFDQLLDHFLLAINYHTLLVEIFAKNLNEASDVGVTMSSFLEQLAFNGLLDLGDMNFGIRSPWVERQKIKAANVEDILEFLYDFSELTEQQRLALVNIALLPAENYPLIFLISLIASGEIGFRSIVKELYQKGWLGGADKTYRISPVIQNLVLGKNSETLAFDAEQMLDNLAGRLENDGSQFIRSLNEIAPFARLVPALSQNLSQFSSPQLKALLLNAGLYFELTGNILAAKQLYEEYGERSSEDNDDEAVATSYQKLGQLYGIEGDSDSAFFYYQEAYKINNELHQAYPDEILYKFNLASSFDQFGQFYQDSGDQKNAFKNFSEYHRIVKEIFDTDPHDVYYKNSLSVTYARLGSFYIGLGDRQNALRYYNDFHRITKEIYQINPKDFVLKNNLSISFSNLGSLYESTGNRKLALEHYLEYQRLIQEIYAANPENLDYKDSLASSYDSLGNFYNGAGDRRNALKYYNEFQKIAKEVNLASPNQLSFKDSLATSFDRLGNFYESAGDRDMALSHYTEFLRITEEIYQINPGYIDYKNNMAISFERLGGFYEGSGDIENTLKYYKLYQGIIRDIYQITPENLFYKNNLAVSFDRLGKVYEALGNWQEALDMYTQYEKFATEVFLASPENLDYKNGLGFSYKRLGAISEAKGNWEEALNYYKERNRIVIEISEASPDNVDYKNNLGFSYLAVGVIYLAQTDIDRALSNLLESIKIAIENHNNNLEILEYQNDLGLTFKRLAEAYSALNDFENESRCSSEFFSHAKDLYGKSPNIIEYKNNYADSCTQMAKVCSRQNKIGEAVTLLFEGRNLLTEVLKETNGQIIEYAYQYGLNSYELSRLGDSVIHRSQPVSDEANKKTEIAELIRKEGLDSVKGLAEQGRLKASQLWLIDALAK